MQSQRHVNALVPPDRRATAEGTDDRGSQRKGRWPARAGGECAVPPFALGRCPLQFLETRGLIRALGFRHRFGTLFHGCAGPVPIRVWNRSHREPRVVQTVLHQAKDWDCWILEKVLFIYSFIFSFIHILKVVL